MTALAAAKTVYAPAHNQKEFVHVTYDFASDGGASGSAVTVLTAGNAVIISDFYALVKTTCTSGGSAAVSVGIESDSDKIMDSIAVASLTANAVIPMIYTQSATGVPSVPSLPLRLAAGALITQTIEVDTLTAGKIDYCFGIMAP